MSTVKSRTFLRYLMCYILVLIFPMGIVTVMFDTQYIKRYRDEITAQIMSGADRALLNLDMNIKQLHAFALQTSLEHEFFPGYMKKASISFINIQNKLSSCVNTNLILSEVAYYNTLYPDTIYTSHGTFSQQYYETYIIDGQKCSPYDYYSRLKEARWVTPDDSFARSRLFEGSVEFSCPVPGLAGGYMSFFIQDDTILEMIELPGTDVDEYMILTLDGNVLVQGNCEPELVHTVQQIVSNDNSGNVARSLTHMDGYGYLMCVGGGTSKLLCVYLLNENAVLGKEESLRKNYYIATLLLIIVCGIAVYVLSLLQVKPISNLALMARRMANNDLAPCSGEAVQGRQNSKLSQNGSDIIQIGRILEQVHSQNERLLRENLQTAQKTVLMRMISGQYMQMWELEQDCRAAHISLGNSGCAVLMMDAQAEHTDVFARNIADMVNADVYGFRYSEQACQIYLLIMNDRHSDHGKMTELIKNAYPDTNAELGGTYYDPLQIYRSYQDATFARRRALINKSMPAREGACVQERNDEHADEQIYPKQDVDALYSILLQKDAEKLSFIHEVLMHAVADKSLNSFMQHSLCYDIINTYNRGLAYWNINGHTENMTYAGLSRCGIIYFDMLIQTIDDLYTEALEAFSKEERLPDDGESARIIEFIKVNSECADMSVGYVADAFGMSISNLSHLFKKQTGDNISDYIATQKLDFARHMLCDSEMSVNDIAERMGYSHPSSFIRMFRRAYGMTPKQYRDIYRGGGGTVM